MIYDVSILMQKLSTAAMNLFIFLYMKKLYKAKYDCKILYITLYILTTILFISVCEVTKNIGVPFLNFVYGFIYIHILNCLFFENDKNKSFIFNSLFITTLTFSDILTVACMSMLNGKSFINVLDDQKNVIVSHIAYILIMLFIWYIFISVLSKNDVSGIKSKQIILLGIFTLFATFVVDSYAQEIQNKKYGWKIIIVMLGFLILNVCLVYFVEQITKLYKEKYEYNLMQQQSKIQLENYNEISKKYEESRKTVHDIKKHLATLSMLKNTDDNRAEEYSKIIEKQIDSLMNGFQCSNTILSIIMSQKILVAETENIKVGTQVEDITFDFISDIDMTAIFANLWDNAIEACVKIINSEKFINVIIGRVNDFIVISFENSYDGIINKKKNEILSTKKNHDGVGLSIIKSALDKYDGIITMSQDESIFKSEILIPIK